MGEWLEQSRPALHEAAHAVINLLFTGRPGDIELAGRGGGSCQAVWAEGFWSGKSPKALLVYRTHSTLAGYCGEELAFGIADVAACSADLEALYEVLRDLKHSPLAIWTREDAHFATRKLLHRFDRQWKGLARRLCGGTLSDVDAWVALQRADPEKELWEFRQQPIMAGSDWRRQWTETVRAVW